MRRSSLDFPSSQPAQESFAHERNVAISSARPLSYDGNMVSLLQPTTRAGKMAAQRLALRLQLWPDISESELWNRKKETGFVVIPRTLPLIMQIQDSLTKNTPVSLTYLDLWSRVFDEGFVRLDKPAEQALAAGFGTNRGPNIWASRLDLLQKEGFIRLAPGAQGPRSFALILNPYLVIQRRRQDIDSRLYNSLMAQALAIGSQAGIPPPTPPVAATPPSIPPPAAPAPTRLAPTQQPTPPPRADTTSSPQRRRRRPRPLPHATG
jgi:hypothetical protein